MEPQLPAEASQKYQENQYTLIFQAIQDSTKDKDPKRLEELRESLIELERNSYPVTNEELVSSKSYFRSHSTPNPSQLPFLSFLDDNRIEKLIRSNTKQYNIKANILLIGHHLSGKSTLVDSYVAKSTSVTPQPTIG